MTLWRLRPSVPTGLTPVAVAGCYYITMRRKKYNNTEDKQKAKQERDKERNLKRIYLKGAYKRWTKLKEGEGLRSDEDLANLLMSSYSKMQTSSPVRGQFQASFSESSSNVSPVHLQDVKENTFFSNTIDETDFTDDGERTMDTHDEDFLPSNASMMQSTFQFQGTDIDLDDLEDIETEDLVADIDEEDSAEEIDESDVIGIDITDAKDAVTEKYVIASEANVLTLAHMKPPDICSCGDFNIETSYRRYGSALIISWVCGRGHAVSQWSSQKRVKERGANTGDLMLAGAVMLSGNNFAKVRLMCRFMHLACIGPSFYHTTQGLFIIPAVQSHWQDLLARNHQKYKDKEICVAGDGRNDSPGHSSQYCTYSVMEHDSHDILAVVTVDKRETMLKSPNMEKLAWERAITTVTDAGIKISEMVTDAHVQITAAMKRNGMKQSYDVWHGAKNLGKKLYEAIGQRKDLQILRPWIRPIVNHFWYCAQHCDSDPTEFKVLWVGILSHVTNKHEWEDPFQGGMRKCAHGQLDDAEREGKEWLPRKSEALDLLRTFVFDKTFMLKVEKYVNCRNTTELEVFHNHILMYAAKRYAFSYEAYITRTYLAAIDFQMHKDRKQAKTKDGKNRYKRIFNKRTANWSPIKVKEPKHYSYIDQIQEGILNRRIAADNASITCRKTLSAEDPRRIAPNLASKPAPSTLQLVEKHRSRLEHQ